MDIRELRYFCSVAELRSFTKAARWLRVAQPAVSRQVRKLEGELGLRLLVRSGTGLELTDAGELLLERAKVMLQQIEQTGHDVMAQSENPSGLVSIGVPSAAGALIMPRVLQIAQRRFPRITLKIVEGIGHILTERLLNGRLSVGLIYDPVPSDGLSIEPLLVERIHLFGRAGSRCSKRKPVTVMDLAELPLILPAKPHNVRVLLEDAAAEFGFKLNIVYEVDSLAVIKSLVGQGAGYGVLTAGSAQDAGGAVLVSKPIETPGMSLTLSVVIRHDLRRSRALQESVKLIRAETRQLLKERAWPGNPKYVRY